MNDSLEIAAMEAAAKKYGHHMIYPPEYHQNVQERGRQKHAPIEYIPSLNSYPNMRLQTGR